MLYSVSPALTVYLMLVAGGGAALVGMINTWPTLMELTLVILLAVAMAETVVLYLLAILYSVSPALTVYLTVVAGGGGGGVVPGITNTWPTRIKL